MKRLFAWVAFASSVCLGQEPQGDAGDPLSAWRWINFLILILGIGYLLAKNLPAYFRARTVAIQKDIADAQKLKQESDQRAADIERRVSGLSAEIEAFRTQSLAEMEREGERIRQETAAHISKIQEQAQVEIESASKAARREVRLYAADLALDLAAQRIRTRLDPGVEAGLVDNFIGDLKRRESNN
jgi:F-type H+-transporting ATPase subunit b